MGSRGNVVFLFPNAQRVYLYTHWGGARIEAALRAAMRRMRDAPGGPRWSDAPYFARVVLAEMVRGCEHDTLGFGVAPTRTLADFDELHVDTEREVVRRVAVELVWKKRVLAGVEEKVVAEWSFDAFEAGEDLVGT